MELKYKSQKYHIDTIIDNNSVTGKINTDKIGLTLEKINNNEFVFNNNGEKQSIYVAENDKFIFANVNGDYFKFEKIAEHEHDYSEEEVIDSNHELIFAQIPGSIVKVLVKEGDEIEEGTALIIIEAMKMETTLYSSISGKIIKINAVEKEQANIDLALIEIRK
jgi:biotin carboxyl carrier protein